MLSFHVILKFYNILQMTRTPGLTLTLILSTWICDHVLCNEILLLGGGGLEMCEAWVLPWGQGWGGQMSLRPGPWSDPELALQEWWGLDRLKGVP